MCMGPRFRSTKDLSLQENKNDFLVFFYLYKIFLKLYVGYNTHNFSNLGMKTPMKFILITSPACILEQVFF